MNAYPFSAVVGQGDAKLALLIAALEPNLGGVLLRGEKGSAKTTLARGLAGLLAPGAPFVEMPLGATEDRVIGSFDIRAALTDGETRLRSGLLAAAHGGVLYVDEINLLADHLVDMLLDVAVSGINRIERDGISHSHPARFVLIGSMNPEEGELRPQLLDRFGLCAEVAAPADVESRVEIVRRRLGHDRGLAAPEGDVALASQLAAATVADVSDSLIESACRIALAVGAEGLRADLMLCRAAAALAGFEQRTAATTDDLRRVAPMVLSHRRRRKPFDPPGFPPESLADALDDALGSNTDDGIDTGPAPDRDTSLGQERSAPAQLRSSTSRQPAGSGRRTFTEGDRGRYVRDVAYDPSTASPIAALPTIRHIAHRRGAGADIDVDGGDLRVAVRSQPAGTLMILVVDASGSMGADARIELATGAALGLLTDAYQNRDQVALITLRGDGASLVLPPTASVEIARTRLAALTTGGVTPLADGLRLAREVAGRERLRTPMIAVLTDGRATGSADALDLAHAQASLIAGDGIRAVVLDCESDGSIRLGLAAELAASMSADYHDASRLDAAGVRTAVLAGAHR